MATSGRPAVNPGNGKPSYVALASDADLFAETTDVKSVEDKVNHLTFDGRVKHPRNKRLLSIKLSGRVVAKTRTVIPPTGTLTITFTDTTPPQTVDVVYVDDP